MKTKKVFFLVLVLLHFDQCDVKNRRANVIQDGSENKETNRVQVPRNSASKRDKDFKTSETDKTNMTQSESNLGKAQSEPNLTVGIHQGNNGDKERAKIANNASTATIAKPTTNKATTTTKTTRRGSKDKEDLAGIAAKLRSLVGDVDDVERKLDIVEELPKEPPLESIEEPLLFTDAMDTVDIITVTSGTRSDYPEPPSESVLKTFANVYKRAIPAYADLMDCGCE